MSDLMNYECVKGARGKAADDGALKAYYKSGTLEAGTDVAMFLKFNPKNPIFVENGEYYEVVPAYHDTSSFLLFLRPALKAIAAPAARIIQSATCIIGYHPSFTHSRTLIVLHLPLSLSYDT